MHQSLVTIALDIQPQNVEAVRTIIGKLKNLVETPASPNFAADPYSQIDAAIPGLHFCSLMVFEDERYDPLLTAELNFDGDPGTFLPQLEGGMFAPFLRDMIRRCKRPPGRGGALYDGVVADGSKMPLTPFLEAMIAGPAAFQQGNRGLDRRRIADEKKLFDAVQGALGEGLADGAQNAQTVHERLRAKMSQSFPWLDAPEPKRWTRPERLADAARLAAFAAAALLCLSAPGILAALIMPAGATKAVCWSALAVVLVALFLLGPKKSAPPPPEIPGLPEQPKPDLAEILSGVAMPLGFFAAYVLLALLAPAVVLAPLNHAPIAAVFKCAAFALGMGILTIPVSIAAIVFWLRRLEDSDPTQEAPPVNPDKLRKIMALEDQVSQNHMGSVVLAKPGLLRAVLLRAGLLGVGLYLRLTATDGYLASMRTIHFAHWAILSNGGRLIFFSNFDSSWESYLDDFIEKAHQGLTLAWTNGVGFPKTQFLTQGGASKGRLFKAWARLSMAESLFWYSAYKDLSVNQIERQFRIAAGLRKPSLNAQEAQEWACDL